MVSVVTMTDLDPYGMTHPHVERPYSITHALVYNVNNKNVPKNRYEYTRNLFKRRNMPNKNSTLYFS